MPLPVLGDMGHSPLQNIPRGRMADWFAHDADLPTNHRRQAGQRIHQFGLAIALHACNAQDLACTHLKRSAVHCLDFAAHPERVNPSHSGPHPQARRVSS